MRPVRVGIVGYGLGGETFHAAVMKSVQGLEISAIVTNDAARQARARAAFPLARIVSSVDELWEDVDVLVVAAPNRMHLPLAVAALERGVHVVVDKPMATSVREAEQMLEAGRDRLTVYQNRRFDGDFRTLQALIRRGGLGRVARFESRFELPPPAAAGDDEATQPTPDKGVLLDLGPHVVDQARLLFGDPVRVYAEVVRRRSEEIEDDVFIALEHADGVRSHLWMCTALPPRAPRFLVAGSDGVFCSEGLDPQEAQLAGGMAPGEAGYGLRTTADGLLPGAYQLFYEGVVAWVRDGAPPPVDPRDGLACMRVLEAAHRSAHTRSLIDLERIS